MTVGGLITLAFFAQRHIFPELDLRSAGAVLLAVAILAALLSLGLTGCSIGAGLALRQSALVFLGMWMGVKPSSGRA